MEDRDNMHGEAPLQADSERPAAPEAAPADEGARQDAPSGSGKRSGKRLVAAAIALVAVVAVAAIAYSQLAPKTQTATAGQLESAAQDSSDDSSQGHYSIVAKDFNVKDADGSATTFYGKRGSKPAVINFWATWCPYCIAEMDEWQALYEKYGGDVEFFMVTPIDTRESAEDAQAYMEQNGYTMPYYLDDDYNALQSYYVSSFPTTVIVSADGKVVSQFSGMIDSQAVSDLLEAQKAA